MLWAKKGALSWLIAVSLQAALAAPLAPAGTDAITADTWLGRGLSVKAGAPRWFAEAAAVAYRSFTRDDYERAAAQFGHLVDNASREVDWRLAFGLRNASLYAAGRHEAALQLICDHRSSGTFRLGESEEIFVIHAHARRLALTFGRDSAAAHLAALRRACGRATFSGVWLGIPLAKMEFLRAGIHVLDEGYVLRDRDRVVLHQFIRSSPTDEFVDYAHYFLHEFERVRRPELTSLRRTGGYTAAEMPHLGWQYYRSQMPGDRHLRSLILGQSFTEVVDYFKRLPPEIRQRVLGDAAAGVPHLEDAAALYKFSVTRDIKALLEYAIQIRGGFGEGRAFVAARIFRHLAENYPDTLVAEKARYLHLLIMRRNGMAETEDRLQEFIRRYPNSHLVDDAYTELARLYRHREPSRYRQLLEFVSEEYADRNAADNALYFLLEDALADRRYSEAFRLASRIATKYAENRLGRISRGLAPQIRAARIALADRKYLEGLALQHKDGRGWIPPPGGLSMAHADAARFPSLQRFQGSRVVSVNGREVTSDVSYFAALAEVRVGSQVPVVVSGFPKGSQRPSETRIDLTATVVEVEVFDVVSVERDDVLNVRSAADYRSQKIGEIPHNAKCVRYAGRAATAGDGRAWFEVRYVPERGRPVQGWVNAHFLRRSEKCLV